MRSAYHLAFPPSSPVDCSSCRGSLSFDPFSVLFSFCLSPTRPSRVREREKGKRDGETERRRDVTAVLHRFPIGVSLAPKEVFGFFSGSAGRGEVGERPRRVQDGGHDNGS